MIELFELLSVVHLVRPAGRVARDLDELLRGIRECSAASLFYHSHQHQLRHPAVDELHPADFVAWVNGVVQDRETAERLSFVIEHRGGSPDELRAALGEVLEALPEKTRLTRDAPEEGQFEFLEMESVLVPTERYCRNCDELLDHLAETNPSVIFYHLVEQPWLAPDQPSLIGWVREQGDQRLVGWLEEAARSGLPLEEMRRRLLRRWRQSTLGRRIAEAGTVPENERREQARRAVASLVRRITQPEESDAGSGS
jgi:hypothetical protein